MVNVERILALFQHQIFLWQDEGRRLLAVEGGPVGPEGTLFWKRVSEALS